MSASAPTPSRRPAKASGGGSPPERRAPRPGGYRLSEAEVGELGGLRAAAGVAARPRRGAALGDRPLRDGLRAGERPRGAERPPARPAGGCSRARARSARPLRRPRRGSGRRPRSRKTHASGSSGPSSSSASLMRGSSLLADGEDAGTALGLAVWVEDGVRAILSRMLRSEGCARTSPEAADEVLIGAGLEAGEGATDQRGGTAEWDAIVPERTRARRVDRGRPAGGRGPGSSSRLPKPRTGSGHRLDGDRGSRQESRPATSTRTTMRRLRSPRARTQDEWIAIGSARSQRGATLEWPAAEGERRPQDRGSGSTHRACAHLFPVPDDADWDGQRARVRAPPGRRRLAAAGPASSRARKRDSLLAASRTGSG